jgi:hypothetical protein
MRGISMIKLSGNPYRKNVNVEDKDETITVNNQQNELLKEILNELKVLSSKIG